MIYFKEVFILYRQNEVNASLFNSVVETKCYPAWGYSFATI